MALTITNLSKTYPNGVKALKNLSLTIGNLMFGPGDRRQLVRFALPRRVYTQSHIDYVGAIGAELAPLRWKLPAMRILTEAPSLRHFSAALAPEAPFPDFEVTW